MDSYVFLLPFLRHSKFSKFSKFSKRRYGLPGTAVKVEAMEVVQPGEATVASKPPWWDIHGIWMAYEWDRNGISMEYR